MEKFSVQPVPFCEEVKAPPQKSEGKIRKSKKTTTMGHRQLERKTSALSTQRKRRTSQAIEQLAPSPKTLRARQTSTSSAPKKTDLQVKIFKDLKTDVRQDFGKTLFGDFWDAFINILDAFSSLYGTGLDAFSSLYGTDLDAFRSLYGTGLDALSSLYGTVSDRSIEDFQIFSEWASVRTRGNIDSKPVIVAWDNKSHRITTASFFQWDQSKNLLLRGLQNGETLFSYDTYYKSGKKRITAWECLDVFLAQYIDHKGWGISAKTLKEKLISSLVDPIPNESDKNKLTVRHFSQFLEADEIDDIGKALFGIDQWYKVESLIDTSYEDYEPSRSQSKTLGVHDIFHLVLKEFIQIMPSQPDQGEIDDVHPETYEPIRRTIATTEFNVSSKKNKLNSEQTYATLMFPIVHAEKYGLTEQDIKIYEFLLAAVMNKKKYYFPVMDFRNTKKDAFINEALWKREHKRYTIYPFLLAFKPGKTSIPDGDDPEIGENIDYDKLLACFFSGDVTPQHHTHKKPRSSYAEPEKRPPPIPSKRKIAPDHKQPKPDKVSNKKSQKPDTQYNWAERLRSQESKRELSVNNRVSESEAKKHESEEEQKFSKGVRKPEEKQEHLENVLTLIIAKKLQFESRATDSEIEASTLRKEKSTLEKKTEELTTEQKMTADQVKTPNHQLKKSREKANKFKDHEKSAEHNLGKARKRLKIKEKDGISRLSLTEDNTCLTNKIDHFQRKIEETNQQANSKKTISTSLQKNILKHEIITKNSEPSNLQEDIVRLEEEHKTLQAQLDEKESSLTSSKNTEKQFKHSTGKSAEKLEISDNELKRKTEESSDLQLRLGTLEKENKELKEKNESLDTKLQDLELKLSTVNQVLVDTQLAKSSLEENIKKLQEDEKKHKKTITMLQEKEEQNKALPEKLDQQRLPPQASQPQFQSSDLTAPIQPWAAGLSHQMYHGSYNIKNREESPAFNSPPISEKNISAVGRCEKSIKLDDGASDATALPWAVAPVVPAASNTLVLQNRTDQANTSQMTGFNFTDDIFDQLPQGTHLNLGRQQPYGSSDLSQLLSSTSSIFQEQVRTRRVTLTHHSNSFPQQGNSQTSHPPAIQQPTATQDNNFSIPDLLCDTDFSAASPGAFNVDSLFNNTLGNDLTPASSQPLPLSSVLNDSHSNCLKASEDFKNHLKLEIEKTF